MQYSFVCSGREILEHLAFLRGRVGEQGKNLIPMAGEHNLVEMGRGPAFKSKRNRLFPALHFANHHAGLDSLLERLGQPPQIAVAATADEFPLGMRVDSQHSMIGKKRINVTAGNDATVSGVIDHTADAIGKR